MLRLLSPIVVAALAGPAVACPPAVALSGDAALVASVGDLLAARGIQRDAAPACPAVHARLARDGEAVVVGIERSNGAPVERRVGEVATAATVIESWTRTDVEAPLLASRAIAPAPAVDADRPPVAASSELLIRGVQLFADAIAARASDSTSWGGVQLGMCINLGAVCAATRLRFATVVDKPDEWQSNIDRESFELMVGLDVPIHIGALTFTPGFAAGMGKMRTNIEHMNHIGETAGLRADIHGTLTIPLRRRWSLDISVTGDMTQALHVETDLHPLVALPDEPRALLWGGIGVRYGGL